MPSSPAVVMLSLAAGCAGWLLGTAAQMLQRELLPAAQAWMLLLAGVAAAAGAVLAASRAAPARRAALRAAWPAMSWPALWLLAAALTAFAIVSLRAQARLDERLPSALEGRDLVVTGLVVQLPHSSALGTRFVFAVESARLAGADGQPVTLPATVSLAWYRNAGPDALLLGPQTEVRAGQRWRLTVRLRRPHGLFNPGGFDLELWLFERGIGAVGSVRSRAGDPATLLAAEAGAPVERLRQQVRDAIERRLAAAGGADARIAGVIAALAIGDQTAIERDDWELFRLTGVAHLMSISGLHVTMFAWLAAGAIGWLWRRSERAMTWLPAPLAARWGGVAVALAYSLFAGWGVPAQRTVGMLAAVAALQSLGARWPLHLVLLAAAAFVVALDPWALLQPGFWLSFAAVGLLAAVQPGAQGEGDSKADSPSPWQRARAVARSALRTQAVATVGLAPLSLVFFQQVSLVGFVANLVAIPLVTLLVTPLALLGVLFAPLWDVAAFVLSGLMRALQWLAPAGSSPTLPAVWQAAAAPAWAMAAGLLGGLVAVLPLPWRLRVLALPLMLPLLLPAVPRPAEGAFEWVALDVGQGTAALVRTRHHLLVYDSGPAFSPEADAGTRLLVPLLRRRGEARVDLLVLSHRDSDHVGGAAAVLAALPVRELSSSLEEGHPLLAQAKAAGALVQRCRAGQAWSWDGVRFEVLHPLPEDYSHAVPKANAMSCVLRVQAAASGPQAHADAAAPTARATSLLLTGDIEAAQETALLSRAAGALRSRILLVPHHGSRTSSSAAFIEAVAPGLAVVQAAYRSRFGHPAPEVAARYEARHITLLRSERCGALTLQSGHEPRCERDAARRYWHDAAPPPER